jgi:hypothetical protein
MIRPLLAALLLTPAAAAQVTTVPTDVQLPGTQPSEAAQLDPSGNCFQCHYGYDAAAEPGHLWSGSMMSHAARDPLYWATVAVAEEVFPGAGDLCLRCHAPRGWLDGRSTPTDGSALNALDAEGVTCALCHMAVDPDEQQHDGIQVPPFVANDGAPLPEGWHGAGEYVITSGFDRLGPYANHQAQHGAQQADFQRDAALCGTCHDVSNPVVGDLAPSHGHAVPLAPGTFSGALGGPVAGKAAFNNPPYAFGVVERTYSEWVASDLGSTRVGAYPSLPADLQRGILADAFAAVTAGVPSGDFQDGTPRTFTCQTCHMMPTTAKGAKQGFLPDRTDLARHDLTGGSTWVQTAIQYLDAQGKLVAGGGLYPEHHTAIADGILRARAMLQGAGAIDVTGDTVRVTNLTGHKLISGYPEGRRMWLEVRWLGPGGELLDAVGEYGPLVVTHKGASLTVESLLEPHEPGLRRYDVHMGLRQDWAQKLLATGQSASLPLAYDRLDGSVAHTLGDAAALAPGASLESFHFVLNDQVLSDTRIPPYGFDRDEAAKRGILPVPASQYGDPAPGGKYLHYDEFTLDPPVGAASAELKLWYQSTSWEYIQFLDLAGTGAVPHLASTGGDLLDAWLNTGMAAPELMTSATWTAQPGDCDHDGVLDALEIAAGAEADCDGNGQPDACQLALDPAADLDGDGGLDTCQWLSADVAGVSLSTGGTQQLALHAGSAHAGELHLVLGSVSGTAPGIPLGAYSLPLVLDGYLDFTLRSANTPLLQGTLGVLDGQGAASAAIQVAPATSPALAGIQAHHAFVTLAPAGLAVTGASNPVSLTLLP